MNALADVRSSSVGELEPHFWVGLVLDHFARGEQALGKLALELGLPISAGSLGSLAEVRKRLVSCDDRKAKLLEKRIARWLGNRPMRHLLAHATLTILLDGDGNRVLITRHLPRDRDDVTPDRLWTQDEQRELLRQASNDGRSIADQVRNILADQALLIELRKP